MIIGLVIGLIVVMLLQMRENALTKVGTIEDISAGRASVGDAMIGGAKLFHNKAAPSDSKLLESARRFCAEVDGAPEVQTIARTASKLSGGIVKDSVKRQGWFSRLFSR